jgi:hypothetical protein
MVVFKQSLESGPTNSEGGEWTMSQSMCPSCGGDILKGECRCPKCGIFVNGPTLEPIPITLELLEWARQRFNDADTMAGIEEIQRTGGFQLKDFIHELEAEATPRE